MLAYDAHYLALETENKYVLSAAGADAAVEVFDER